MRAAQANGGFAMLLAPAGLSTIISGVGQKAIRQPDLQHIALPDQHMHTSVHVWFVDIGVDIAVTRTFVNGLAFATMGATVPTPNAVNVFGRGGGFSGTAHVKADSSLGGVNSDATFRGSGIQFSIALSISSAVAGGRLLPYVSVVSATASIDSVSLSMDSGSIPGFLWDHIRSNAESSLRNQFNSQAGPMIAQKLRAEIAKFSDFIALQFSPMVRPHATPCCGPFACTGTAGAVAQAAAAAAYCRRDSRWVECRWCWTHHSSAAPFRSTHSARNCR